jgi:anti-anti-sigma factor
MPPLRIEFHDNDDYSCTLQWIGSVESKNCHLMWFFDNSETLLQHLNDVNANRLIIDLSAADRVDSEALRRLFQARQNFLRHNIRIILRQPNPHLRRLLRIMQFDQIFTIEEAGHS